MLPPQVMVRVFVGESAALARLKLEALGLPLILACIKTRNPPSETN